MPETNTLSNAAVERRRYYGLPCVKCSTYYFSDLDSCPVCRSRDRVGRPALPLVDAPAALLSSNLASKTATRQAEMRPWPLDLDDAEDAAMRKISMAEFRSRCAQVLDQVGVTGETVLLTRKGRPVARIVPLEMLPEAPAIS